MKLFWKKFSAVALIGAMLSNVGCTYKADIEELNRQVEALKGTVALKADVQKIQTTVEQIAGVDFSQFLKTADFAAQLKASGVAYSSDLKAWLTSDEVKAMIEGYQYQTAEDVLKLIAGFMTQEDVEKMIEGLQSKEDVEKMIKDLMSKEDVEKMIEGLQSKEGVEAIFDAMIKAYDIWGAVSGDVAAAIADAMKNAEFMTGESKLSDAQVNQVMSEIAKAFGAEGADVKAAIDGWLGANFAKYMEAYEPTEAFIAKLGIGSSAVDAVLAEVGKENSDLVKAINKLITEATDGAVTEDILKDTFDSYKQNLEALTNRVAELEGRIQSIVWVPQTLTEVNEHKVILGARNTITLKPTAEEKKANKDAEDKVVVLSNSEKTVVWEVAPKSALAKIDDPATQIEVYSNKVAVDTKAEERPTWKTTAVKIDPEKGTVAVTISAEEQLDKEEEMDVIALHISVPSKAEGSIGIDYTSDYILVDQKDGEDYPKTSPFVFSKGELAEEFSADGITANFNKLYTETGAVTFLDGAVAVKDGEVDGKPIYTAITEKWAAAFAEDGDLKLVFTQETKDGKKVLPEVKGGLSDADIEAMLDLTADGFTVKKSGSALVDKTVISGKITYTITDKDSKYELPLGDVKVAYKFTKEEKEVKVSPAEFSWHYGTTYYSTPNDDDAKKKLTVSGLSADVFNANINYLWGKLVDYSGDEPKTISESVILNKYSNPTVDSDVMLADLMITVNSMAFVKGGDYTAEFEFATKDSKMTVNVPVKVKGAPKLTGLEIPAIVFDYTGATEYTVMEADEKTGFIAQLIAANEHLWDEETEKGEHIDKDQFEKMITKGGKAPKDGNKVDFSDANGALTVEFTAEQINDEKVYPVSLEYGTEDFGFAIKTKVSLVTPKVTLVANPALVGANGALVKSDFVNGELKAEPKSLVNVYDPMTKGKVNEHVTVTYSIVREYKKDKDDKKIPADDQTKALDKLSADGKAIPSIDDKNVLTWGDWPMLTLNVKAEAKIENEVVATEIFTAYVNDPVAAKIIVNSSKLPTDLYAGKETKDLADYFTLTAGSKKVDVIARDEAANLANAKTGLDGKFEFEIVGDTNSVVELKGDKITVKENSVDFVKAFDIKVKVTYTYKYSAVPRIEYITFKVKPDAK